MSPSKYNPFTDKLDFISGVGTSVPGGTAGSVLFVDASGNLGQSNANFFWDNTNKRLGLGTASPGAKLHVNAGSTSAALGFEMTGGAANDYIDFQMVGTNTTTAARQIFSAGSQSSFIYNYSGSSFDPYPSVVWKHNLPLRFLSQDNYVTGASSNLRMVIDGSSGNVGIGIATPLLGLHLAKQYAIISNSDFVSGSVGSALVIGMGASSGDTYSLLQGTLTGNTANGNLALNPNGANVGIGTAAPSAKLHVKGSGTGNIMMDEWGGGNTYAGLSMNGSMASGSYNILSSPSDTNFYINRPTGKAIHFRENNVSQMTILSGGVVQMGPATSSFAVTGASVRGDGTAGVGIPFLVEASSGGNTGAFAASVTNTDIATPFLGAGFYVWNTSATAGNFSSISFLTAGGNQYAGIFAKARQHTAGFPIGDLFFGVYNSDPNNIVIPLYITAEGNSLFGGAIVPDATLSTIPVQVIKSANDQVSASIMIKNSNTGTTAGPTLFVTQDPSTAKWGYFGYFNSGNTFPAPFATNQVVIGGGAGATNGLLLATQTTAPIAFATNSVERARFDSVGNFGFGTSTFGASSVGVMAIKNGTAPTGNVTDCFHHYAADQTAGNCAPHWRTENGSVVKLYKVATYTPTNVTTDRSYDANATTLDEVADVLGSLIADLQSLGVLG
jgi:hypothetical protein